MVIITATPAALASSSNSRSVCCEAGSRPTTGSSSTSSECGRISAQRELDLLPHPPRERTRLRVALALEAEPGQQLIDPLVEVIAGDAMRDRD